VVDASLAQAVVESYIEMQQRFVVGDWGPAELDGGRLCETISQCLFQMDTGKLNRSLSVGDIRKKLLDNTVSHVLDAKDRQHIAKVIEVVYKFRSSRGIAHVSPNYTANRMDAMLVLHSGKWIFAEFLRLAWNQDRNVIAEVIGQIVQLEHSLIHELDGKPLVLAKDISAPDEVLLLLNHAPNHRLNRSEIRQYASTQKAETINVTISRLIKQKYIRPVNDREVALTPMGQKRVMEEIVPKFDPKRP
jgi:hypothetical protein